MSWIEGTDIKSRIASCNLEGISCHDRKSSLSDRRLVALRKKVSNTSARSVDALSSSVLIKVSWMIRSCFMYLIRYGASLTSATSLGGLGGLRSAWGGPNGLR